MALLIRMHIKKEEKGRSPLFFFSIKRVAQRRKKLSYFD
jgi:hypothetical protein